MRLRILTTTLLGQAHYHRSEYERVVELATDSIAALPADWVYKHFGNVAPASVLDRLYLGLPLAELGRFAGEAACAADAIRPAESTHHAFSMGWAHYILPACPLHLFYHGVLAPHARLS